MSAKTGIQWTDRTWNPVRGCSRVSEGCRQCYAERVASRFSAHQNPALPFVGFAKDGKWTGRVELVPDKLTEPLSWRKPCRVFVNSMSDLFHESLSDADIDRVFAVMALAPRHTFQVLTKRADRMRRYFARENARVTVLGIAWSMLGNPRLRNYRHDGIESRPWPLPNVWLGVSVENQETADERIPHLLATPAAVRFLSCEPLLGPVDLRFCEGSSIFFDRDPDEDSPVATIACPSGRHWVNQFEHVIHTCGLDWVIVGGESGPGARPCDVAWIRSIVTQCKAAVVKCFVKQLGALVISNGCTGPGEHWPNGVIGGEGMVGSRVVWHHRLRDRKGGDMSEWPADLRVREMPVTKGES